MKTKPITKLEERLNSDHASKLKDYREIMARRKEAVPIIKQMPPDLANMEWWLFKKQEGEDNVWFLDSWYLGEEEADAIIDQLKLMGIHGLKSTYRNSINRWEYKGSIKVGDTIINIRVDGGSKPPNCRIEETRDMKEVITYKAICEETEGEV